MGKNLYSISSKGLLSDCFQFIISSFQLKRLLGMIRKYLLVALHVSEHTSLVLHTFPKLNIEI